MQDHSPKAQSCYSDGIPDLHALGLVDTPTNEVYDKFTRLVTTSLGTPVALVSIVQEELDRQYFTSQIGLEGDWAVSRQTPLSHSFCQYVKRQDKPLVIEDAPANSLVCDNMAIPDLGVRAYLGVPIHGPDGQAIGALCAIDSVPREWTEKDVAMMVDLAACVDEHIRLRANLLLQMIAL